MNRYQTIVLLLLLSIAPFCTAAEYHVSPSGNDNDAGLAGSPWRTIGRANSGVSAGDTVILATGTYSDSIAPSASGQPGRPITFRAAVGATPIVDKGRLLRGGWELVSGQEGIDAIYRKQGSHSDLGMLREDDLATNGRNTLYWNRGYQTNRHVDTTFVIERPGDYYHQNGYFYVRTNDSRHPDTHDVIELRDEAIKIDGKSYIVLDGITFRNPERHTNADNSHHVTIQNCVFEYSKGFGGLTWKNSDYWVVRNNILRGHGSINAHKGDLFNMLSTEYSIVEGNTISFTAHLAMKLEGNSRYNIIRGNHFSDVYGKTISIAGSTSHTLIEDNTFTDAPTSDMLQLQHFSDHTALQLGSNHAIVRRNRFHDGSGGITFAEADPTLGSEISDHVVVHNSIAGNRGTDRARGDAIAIYKAQVRRPLIANNIMSENRTANGKGGQLGFRSEILNSSDMNNMQVEIENNILFSSARPAEVFQDSYTVSQFEQNWGQYIKNNIQIDPEILGSESQFALRPGSPAIDAGRFLTRTVGTGEGTEVNVIDARAFFDGFTLDQGDLIRVGDELARVAGVNYNTNVLTLDRTIAWNDGDGVSYQFTGSRPDIGALEFDGQSSATIPVPPSGLAAL